MRRLIIKKWQGQHHSWKFSSIPKMIYWIIWIFLLWENIPLAAVINWGYFKETNMTWGPWGRSSDANQSLKMMDLIKLPVKMSLNESISRTQWNHQSSWNKYSNSHRMLTNIFLWKFFEYKMLMSPWVCLKMYAFHTPSRGGQKGNSHNAGRTSLSTVRFRIRRSGSSVWFHQSWCFGRQICYFHQESWVQFISGWHKIYVMIYRVLML